MIIDVSNGTVNSVPFVDFVRVPLDNSVIDDVMATGYFDRWRWLRQLSVEQFQVFIVAVISGHVIVRRWRREPSQRGVERAAYFRHAQSLVGLSTPTSGHNATHFRWTAARRKQGSARLDALDDLPIRPHTLFTNKPGIG